MKKFFLITLAFVSLSIMSVQNAAAAQPEYNVHHKGPKKDKGPKKEKKAKGPKDDKDRPRPPKNDRDRPDPRRGKYDDKDRFDRPSPRHMGGRNGRAEDIDYRLDILETRYDRDKDMLKNSDLDKYDREIKEKELKYHYKREKERLKAEKKALKGGSFYSR